MQDTGEIIRYGYWKRFLGQQNSLRKTNIPESAFAHHK